MKLKNLFRGVFALFVASSSLVSPTSVLANTPRPNETVYRDYDENRTGSLTLYKYVSNDGKSIESTGQSLGANSGEQLEAIQNATGSYKMLPEKGVSFAYKKVADYRQINSDSKAKWYITNVDQGFLDLFNQYGVAVTADSNGNYDSTKMMQSLSALEKAPGTAETGETALREYTKNSGTVFTDKTNNYGKTKVDGLPVGLYLVSEIDWEHQSIAKHDTYWARLDGTEDAGDGSSYADIVSPSSPFLVQLPIMASNGDGWIYDVTAYPKNGTLTVHKDIIVNQPGDGKDNDGLDTYKTETLCDFAQINYANSNQYGEYDQGFDDDTQIDGNKTPFLTHQIDVSFGDTVRQVISSDVPALIGEKFNKKYAVTDRMTQGLTFTQIDKVSVGTGLWNDRNNHVLTEGTDYTLTVAGDKKSFTVDLTDQGLAYLDGIGSAAYFYVEFDSVLNKDAMVGTDTYKYTTADGNTVDATNQNTAMLTYRTDRTAEHDYYSNTCRVYTYELDLTKMIPNMPNGMDYTSVGFTMTGSTADGGTENLQFIKDGEGQYHIYDQYTEAGTTPETTVYCSADGKLAIKGVDARDYVITEVSTVKGKQLLAEPLTVRLEGHKQVDGYSRYFENGVLDHAYAWSGEEPLKLTNYDIANTASVQLKTGRAPFLITNESFSMLRTGGNGNIIATAVGITAIAAFGVCLALKKKRDMVSE